MSTGYYSHESCPMHDMGGGHPESPARLIAVEQGLDLVGATRRITRKKAPAAPLEAIKRVHAADYVDTLITQSPSKGLRQLDADTAINAHSIEAAIHAAGAVVDAVDAVLAGEIANAFCAVRPPGHHAERARAMGFCLFDNIAIGAAHALQCHGLERVAVLDFDVHHGNGTEDVLADEPRALFCSSYQNPLFPFTLDVSIPGQLIKSPLSPGSTGRAFRQVVERDWLPALDAFKPEMIFVSAGFDAHRCDPLADLLLEAEDFAWVSQRISEAAHRYCDGRIVSTLEGGYALDALAASAAVHVRALCDAGE